MVTRKDHCVLWTGKHSPEGYGVIRHNGRSLMLHRVLWAGVNGPIPDGKIVMHKCDTPACFRIGHLSLGTRDDNNKDRMRKGRSAVGEKSGRHKLTAVEVGEIRELYGKGALSQVDLGKSYGVSSHTVSMICRGSIWKNCAA